MPVLIAAAFTACSKKTADDPNGSHDTGTAALMHIHGLGYSSDGKRLLIPAHNGIKVYTDGKWSDAPGEKHDYMGCSIADNGFYSSGHPAVGSSYKNPMGLIKSTDEGKSITVLALEGEVDLHGMSVSYRTHTLYVINPEPNSKMKQAGFFYSRDQGKTWVSSPMSGISGQITALAVHPTQDAIVVIGTTSGAYLSKDNGQTFAALYTDQPVSAVTFTVQGELLIGIGKSELVSVNLETKQRTAIKTPVQNGDAISYLSGSPTNPKELALAIEKKDVYMSTDFGTTWQRIANQGQAINR
ncbi:F510_1955 family glycosylhydrolase [Paenibacillus alginolyticus]|uniref:Glycosyl hydrolase n=1 Tax=Paenibacillus alginolyticus TaxID=59839 RepID=A0ABT4GDD7_9BACL|nr:glycosyl hydrolase [Paenibacillus alginolyticus]MCY9694202.1 glycosyl hydrolase [Paenibacillus alginolyticus]MEC0142752.1 glycosyl hydrolase [Paenibacillus alginolyticus]